jgi:hypothetical protein
MHPSNSKYQESMLKQEHGRGNIQEIDSQFWQDMRPAAGQPAAGTQFAVRDRRHREMRLRGVFLSAPVNAGYRRRMREKCGRNNLETVFGVSALPSDTRIRTQMDLIPPEQFGGVFNSALKIADEAGLLDGYRVPGGGALIALDGVWYHSSEKIHCDRCPRQTKAGVTTYYHSALAGVIVKPGDTCVMPVMAEMTVNGDGEKKRDCELAAAKRR